MRPTHAILLPIHHPGFLVAFLILLVCGPPVLADDLGFFESRRILSEADAALAAGRLDEASELYNRVADGTESGKGRHAKALLGVAVSELSQNHARLDVARNRLAAYLADPAAERRSEARALQKLLDRVESAPAAAPPRPEPPKPKPVEPVDEAPSDDAKRIVALEQQLAAARDEIAQKEKVIEELRKIVVEGGG